MKKFINVLAVLLALVMCLGIVVACADGEDDKATDGTTTPQATTTTKAITTTTAADTTTVEVTTDREDNDNPTPTVDVPADGVITNAAQLHAVLVNGASDKDYTVNATEIDMAGLKWTGLKDYAATFDFGGCIVKNVSYPMFTSVIGGTVKNLVLADSTQVYTNDESEEDKDLIAIGTADEQCRVYGGVIRYMNDGVISNITVESTVSISADIWVNDSYVGGIVAYAKGTNIRIENCTFKGNVATDSYKIFIGGIAGCVEGTDTAAHNVDDLLSSSVIGINCVNYGNVSNFARGNDSKVAGVFGAFGSGLVYKCANHGNITDNDQGQTGGVIGHTMNDLTYMYCLNTGTVKGGNGYVSGIAAYSRGNVRNFVGCVNIGTIGNSEGLSTNRMAGIMGWSRQNENFVDCYNLTTGHANWVFGNGTVINPADPATYTTETGAVTVTGGGNLDTVDAIYTAIEAVHPGVYAKSGDSIDFVK